MYQASVIDQHICPTVTPRVAAVLEKVPPRIKCQINEIRLRTGLPLIIAAGRTDTMITEAGEPVKDSHKAFIVSQTDLLKTLQIMSKSSLYALENEIRSGFITIAGGHRVGLAGQALVEDGQVKSLKNISSINIRIAREMKGCSDTLLPWLIGVNGQVLSTLIVSPPRCGKTTMVRDIVRQFSIGVERLGLAGLQVGVVDERSEIAACQHGVPTMDLGPRVDVLDCCPKARGLLMLIRALAPQVVITDELGRKEDTMAVEEALHAGVSVIATVHGRSVADIRRRPHVGKLVTEGYFDRYVILSNTPTVGTIAQVAASNGDILYTC